MADPMNLSPSNVGLTPQIWDDRFFAEYIRKNQFAKLMGSNEEAVIQLKDDLERRPGDRVTFAFVGRLTGAGVRGHQVLRGNEEILNDRSMGVIINPIRHAVAIDKWTAQQSAINKRNAAKVALKNWSIELMRADTITSLLAIAPQITYGAGTATQQNAWVSNNADRVMFGNTLSNTTGVGSTSLLNVSAAVGRMSKSVLETAKRQARMAHPRIRPYMDKDGTEWFVAFLHPYAFRDLRNDPSYRTDMQFALERGKGNPLFSGGDLITDGIIVKEEPDMPLLTGVGTGGVNVAQCVMLGAQAIGMAWAQRTQTTEDSYDYKWENGVGIEEIRGIDKLRFGTGPNDQDNLKDHGVYTMFVAAPPDA